MKTDLIPTKRDRRTVHGERIVTYNGPVMIQKESGISNHFGIPL